MNREEWGKLARTWGNVIGLADSADRLIQLSAGQCAHLRTERGLCSRELDVLRSRPVSGGAATPESYASLEMSQGRGALAENRPEQPAPRPPCFLDGGPFCPAARAGVGAKLGLSPAQREVAGLVVGHLSDKEIARALHIRPKTVRTHLDDISRILKAHGRGEIVRKLLDAHAAWLADAPPNAPHPFGVG